MSKTISNTCRLCTSMKPLKRGGKVCRKCKYKITNVRIYCPSDFTEVYAEANDDTTNPCTNGYVSNLIIDPELNDATPLICVDVLNPDDIDETNNFSFDLDTEEATDSYALGPLKVKVYDPDDQCTVDSLKCQRVGIVYQICNKEGDWIWRRIFATLTELTGGIINGYELNFNSGDVCNEERPLFVNLGDGETTTDAIDALTNFG